MRARWYLLISFAVLTLFATSLAAQLPEENPDPNPGGGGGGGCYVCVTVTYPNGMQVQYCGSPVSGGWGENNCVVESYPEGSYCYTFGDACCVD
jgi:hypothetical protein